MNRRTLLAVAGASLSLAGCLADEPAGPGGNETTPEDDGGAENDTGSSGNESDSDDGSEGGEEDGGKQADPTYEQCERDVVWYTELPDAVAKEVDIVLEDGVYETDGDLFYEQAIDVDSAALSTDDTYYAATVDGGGDAKRLTLEETTPTKSSEQELAVINGLDDAEIDVTVTVEDGDDVLLEEVLEGLEPGYEHERRFSVTDEYGEYEVAVEFDDGTIETGTWRIEYAVWDGVVTIADEVSVGPESVADIAECPWDY